MLQTAMYGIGDYAGKEDDELSSLGLAHRVVLDLLDRDQLKNKGTMFTWTTFTPAPLCSRIRVREGLSHVV